MVGSKLFTHKPIKFVCSYGGRILPRYPDGKLRYHGGETRVLSADCAISFAELMVKMGEMCGSPAASLRCQLPAEDLDALVSITSDEDLINLIEEYNLTAAPLKIRAFLSAPKKPSPPSSAASGHGLPPKSCRRQCGRHAAKPPAYPRVSGVKAAGKSAHQFGYQFRISSGSGGLVHLVHNGYHWQ